MRRWIAVAAGAALLICAGLVRAQSPDAQPDAPPPPGAEEAPPADVQPPPPAAINPPPAEVTPDTPPPTASKSQAATPAAPVVPDKPPPPLRRPRTAYAVLQVLDKVTTETLRFQAPVGGAVRYKTLVFQVTACETNAADEDMKDAAAYVTVTSQPLSPGGGPPPPAKQVFKGWMYASSPGLNPLQHPVYDAWVIACSAPAPSAAPSK
jgi:hypothetical protein